MPHYALDDLTPTLPEDDDFWIAPDAHVIGQATLAPGSSVWFGTTIRADNEPILLGEGSNIQENCVLHVDPGYPLTIGKNCTIGHKAMLHGCTIGDGSLIGMGAIVLNGAKIGKNCLIGAGALVTERSEIPDGSMVLGAPARVKRPLSEAEIQGLAKSAEKYRWNMNRFKTSLRPL